MVCSFCGSAISAGDKFCMVCGTAVSAMNAAAQASNIPEIKIDNIPEVTADIPAATTAPVEAQAVSPAPAPAAEAAAPVAEAPAQPVGAYFADQQNAPSPAPEPVYAQPQQFFAGQAGQTGQAVYGESQSIPPYTQPVYGQPQGTPAYAQPVYGQPQGQPVYGQPIFMGPEQEAAATKILTLGIVALALAISFIASLGGIIVGAIGLSKSNEFLKKNGAFPTKALVGRHLSRAGLIAGIVISALSSLYYLAIIIEALDRYI